MSTPGRIYISLGKGSSVWSLLEESIVKNALYAYKDV